MDASLLGALLFLCGILAAIYAAHRISFWKAEGIRVLKPGHLPPLPRLSARLVRLVLGYAFVFLFVGRLRIVGKRNLRYGGRLIVLGNHQTERDAILLPYLMRLRSVRYFIAKNQALGLRAPLVAYSGGIVVEHATKRGPVAALTTAIKAMIAEPTTDFVIFPQGRLVRDNDLRREDFYPGAAVLGDKVARKSESTLAYLPVGFYYDHDLRNATPLHKALNRLGFKGFRSFFGEVIYGAVLVVGEPIPVQCLPDNADQATDVLFESVVALSKRAELYGAPDSER